MDELKLARACFDINAPRVSYHCWSNGEGEKFGVLDWLETAFRVSCTILAEGESSLAPSDKRQPSRIQALSILPSAGVSRVVSGEE